MKKFPLTLLIATLAAVKCFSAVIVDGLPYELYDEDLHAVLTNDNSAHPTGDVIIPEKIEYNGKIYSVTEIGQAACWAWTGMTSITICNSIKKIGNNAFYRCTSLTSLHIPNSVSEIGESPVTWCPNIATITIDEDNEVYDSRGNCNAIIQTSESRLISGCKNTIIPDGIIEIGIWAFSNCETLTEVNIPNTVTTIGSYAFQGTSLSKLFIPKSVTSIGAGIINGSTNIVEEIIVEEGNPNYDSRNNCNAIIETSKNNLTSCGDKCLK